MPKSSSKLRRLPSTDSVSAREVLLVAAKKLFARRGLSGVSIRDIAKEANMNSSQISYYFDSKEGLYRACIQNIAENRLKIAEQILVTPTSREEFKVRLRLFVDNLFHDFLEDRDAGLIIIREYDRLQSPAAKIFKSYFAQLFTLLTKFFGAAVKDQLIAALGNFKIQNKNSKPDSITITSLFFGVLMSELRFDHIKEDLFSRTIRNSRERKLVTDHIVELFT